VTVNGTTYTLGTSSQLTSDGSGHWTLTTSSTIPDGTYSVSVHTADAAGNVSDTTATNALTVDTIPPATPTVNSLVTNSSMPILTGTWDQGTRGGAVVLQVTVNGTTFTLGTSSQLTSDSSGHWTLTTSTAIPDGTYNVSVHTADAAGNVSDTTAVNALTIHTAAPAAPATPTVNSLITGNSTPTLTGTWDSVNAAVLQVTITNADRSSSVTYTLGTSPQLSVSGGSWTLNLTGTTPMHNGSYNVSVHTANAVGVSADSASGHLVINSSPVPVVGPLLSKAAEVGNPVRILAAMIGSSTSGLKVTIQWGDGTTTTGTFATLCGVLTVSGSHSYSNAGTFQIRLTVTNASGRCTTVATTATISRHGNPNSDGHGNSDSKGQCNHGK
jgi:hypothetical protein